MIELIVMRLADMKRVHPDQITGTCAGCGHAVGIFPSGQLVMQQNQDVRLMCQVCKTPGPNAALAPGAQFEPFQSVKETMIDIVFPDDESCPDCGCTIFRPGPRGGMGQNIECARCKARFNVCRYYPELDPAYVAQHGWPAGADQLSKGKIVLAERIPSEKDGGGEWREDMFPKVLE